MTSAKITGFTLILCITLGFLSSFAWFQKASVRNVLAESDFASGDPTAWPTGTCVAVDTTDDAGGYVYRDILAVCYEEGSNELYFRVDFLKLEGIDYAPYLNVYVLIDFEPGGQSYLPDYIWDGQVRGYEWELCIAVYNSSSATLYDLNWQNVSGLSWQFHDFQGMLACNVSKSTADDYGFTNGETVYIRVATVRDGQSGLRDICPNDSLSDGYWDGALASNSHTVTTKLAFVHHGNQHINPFTSGVVDDGQGHGFYRILDSHEEYGLPVNIHMSGVLITSLVWNNPSFLERIKNLTSRGLVEILGSVYGQHIMPYLDECLNTWALNKHKELCQRYFNATPRVAWVPERVWKYFLDNDFSNTGFEAVVLDGQTHHNDYCGCGNYHLTHKISTSYDVYAFFICERWYGTDFPGANSDWHLDFKKHWAGIVRAGDEKQICVYGDDWEKAAGVANWPTGNPNNYDSMIRWLAGAKPWIQVVKLSDYLDWYTQPTSGVTITITEDTYGGLKYWTGGSYDNWYNDFKYWVPYGCTKTAETLWKDVLQALNYSSSFNTSTPSGRLKELAMWTLASNLYETAWHEWDGSDWVLCGWGKEIWAHLRYAMILVKAANWTENPPATPQIYWEDVDDDGANELIMCNDKIYFVIERIGGRIVFAATKDGRVYIGNYMVQYRGTEGDYNDDDHVGALTDKWYTYNNHDYSHELYTVQIEVSNQTHVQAKMVSPDAYITKKATLRKGSYGLRVQYSQKYAGTLYVRLGSFSPDLETMLYEGKKVLQTLGSGGQGFMGWKNTVTNASAVVAWQYPGAAYSWAWTLTFAKMVEIKSLALNFCFDLTFAPLQNETEFAFSTLYSAYLNVYTSFTEGSKLVAAFYTYSGVQKANITVWRGVTPNWVALYMEVWHPLGLPIENVTLFLVDEEGNILSKVTSFLVTRAHLQARTEELKQKWTDAALEEKTVLMREIAEIDSQWPYAPG
ncbi:MAG TPA: hypothetical protein ENF76_04925 [Candidatus Bathyarchaeota archaeon]|nr:hypothetical protein [Candidatus Bathyarchaeota archaeon]